MGYGAPYLRRDGERKCNGSQACQSCKCPQGIIRMTARFPLLLAWLVACAMPAPAMPRRIQLDPSTSEVAFRAYGLGLLPLDGHFTRFGGWLTYDPDNHATCQVDLRADVASLVTDDPAVRDTVLGADFMDASRYPHLEYTGTCGPSGLGGMLGMHGVTKPFALALTWEQREVVAEGRLVRADWGMTQRAVLGGRTVRIRVTVPLPTS